MLVAYIFELVFITIFYISQIPWCGVSVDMTYNKPIHRSLCPPAAAHEKCTGCVGKCGCSTVMIHSECCDAFHQRKQFTGGGWQHKRAMKETTASFLDAAIFFALSIGIGAVGTAASQNLTLYESNVLGFAFLLTCSPLYIVVAFSSKTLRRKRLRRNLISLVVTLFFCATVIILHFSKWGDRWDAICAPGVYNSYWSKAIIPACAIYFAFILECLRALVWLFRPVLRRYLPNWWPFTRTLPDKPSGHRRYSQRVLGLWKRYIYHWASDKTSIWMVASTGFVLTLFGAVSLALERARMQGIAGKDYQESEMTYGQYLAMLIWVPVLVEYTYVASCK